jgi:hypothetical protein
MKTSKKGKNIFRKHCHARFSLDKSRGSEYCSRIASSIIGRWRLREACTPACCDEVHMTSSIKFPLTVPITLIVATLVAGSVVSFAIYRIVAAGMLAG